MELGDFTIAEIATEFSKGEFTSADLCEAYLRRIDEIDKTGPTLRSVIELNPDALDIADKLDQERGAGTVRGPLHGVPLMVKDSIDTGDKMMTTAGSVVMIGHRAQNDAFTVARLRAAGAVILGKTNMSEWGYMRSTRACSGWSSRGGQVRNPYALDRNPSGSSSGSAVAVAANLCAGALGAEVDGSVVRPSSINGIVGLKPTVGLLSRSGVIGVAEPQDTVGPMARTVADVAVLLSAMAGPDPSDPATLDHAANRLEDYGRALSTDALKGARIGVARDCFGFHEGTDAVVEDAVKVLADLGAEIVDPANGSYLTLFGETEAAFMAFQLKASINRYLAEHPQAPVRDIHELIEANRTHADVVMPYFQQEFFEMAAATGGLDSQEYIDLAAACRRMSRDEGIDKVLAAHRLDAIIAPTDGHPAWAIDPIVGDKIKGGCSSPPAMAGYPHVTVPAGYVDGLPVALSFYGAAYSDGDLLGFAYAFEQATQVRRPPSFPSTVTP
ncbi:MAG: amidase [Rhodobacteraceae bacterium]|nr:amidase [Paracoccaceae bacterium]